jgi:LPS sulfotransferase NodH
MSKNGQHVVPSADGWSVRRAGAARASSLHSTQKEAISAATTIARSQQTELYIHGKDGRIRARNTYGHDPHPPKG